MENTKTIGYAILEAFESPSEAQVISESNRRVVAEGILQTAEETNRNGRCYLHEDLMREITCPRTMELLKAGQMRGESGHPCDNSIIRQQTVQPDHCSVKYLKMWMDGNNVMAHFQGTNNALGEAFDLDLRDGDKPSFSLRALGTLKNNGGRNVVENLKMICYDQVIYPSHVGAYATRLVTETSNMAAANGFDSRPVMEQSVNKNGLLLPITNAAVMSYIKNESTNIMSMINQFEFMYESMSLINNGSAVQLVGKNGDVFVVNLESHIQNEIFDYCSKH